MAESQSQRIEELMPELEEDYGAQEPSSAKVEQVRQRPRAVSRRPSWGRGVVQTLEEVQDSLLPAVFHDRGWKWAPIYAIALIAATTLYYVVSYFWMLMVAGVVWLAGAVLGLVVLQRKGYPAGRTVSGLLDLADDSRGPGWLLLLFALFTVCGPLILLVALFVRPRGSAARVAKRRAAAKNAGRSTSSPANGNRAWECPACGAWNPLGIKHCGECNATLEGSVVKDGTLEEGVHRCGAV